VAAGAVPGKEILVTPPTMLVTPQGHWVAPESEEFLAELGDCAPGCDCVAFAVKDRGFVKVHIANDALIEIELRPRAVELQALLAVQQQLVSAKVKLFRIKFFDTEWRSEISASVEHVVTRLSELCAPDFAPPPTERFQVEPQDMETLFADENNPLRPLAQKWRVSLGKFDPSVISLAVTHQLLSRLMIAGIRPNQAEPTWRFIGDGHKWIGDRFRVGGLGDKVGNMPDRSYGEWATQFYLSVAKTGQPRYDFVTGSVQYEDEAGKPLKAVRYERLMLPWKTPSDEVFVTMCSKRFGTDDIPSLEESTSARSS
jgi:hypothetical protein